MQVELFHPVTRCLPQLQKHLSADVPCHCDCAVTEVAFEKVHPSFLFSMTQLSFCIESKEGSGKAF